jgi:hypothetical protein
MLLHKDISKIDEIKTFFKDSWLEPLVLSKQMSLIKLNKSLSFFKMAKTKGVSFFDVLKLLLFLPMLNVRSIHDALSSETEKKDVYYRGLANQKINWRSLLLSTSKRYIDLDEDSSTNKCVIFDDTVIEKTGKKIEGISKIHDHVTKRYFFGFKLLVAGYWNGSLFIPIDFSFHRESKNSKKKYGLTQKERSKQKKTNRTNSNYARTRFKELNKKKTDVMIDMFKRIIKRKITVDYILIDSWFTSVDVIKRFLNINNKIHVIGMYKYNSKALIDGKLIKFDSLKKNSEKLKRSRSYKMYYKIFDVDMGGIPMRVFIIRKGTNGAWHTIVTTNKKLTFTKMMKLYSIRWSIEVFFKEAKQLLHLGKNQSTNFDVQVAHTTLTMIQYQLLSLKYRMEAYQTIGGIFSSVKQEIIEHKLYERIIVVISEILTVLESFVEGLDLDLTMRKLIQYSSQFTFLNNSTENQSKYKSAA